MKGTQYALSFVTDIFIIGGILVLVHLHPLRPFQQTQLAQVSQMKVRLCHCNGD